MGFLLGLDVGSSSVKASLLEVATGAWAGRATRPDIELAIHAPRPGHAEQDPQTWYDCARDAIRQAMAEAGARADDVQALGIAYQMHGLVCVDRDGQVLRPAILWCDGRAVAHGDRAFEVLGSEWCLEHLLNSPGNFTAAKLAWVKEHEPEVFGRIHKVLLPGDWLALRLTGAARTTVSGLSEGVFWDFLEERPCDRLLQHFGFDPELLPDRVASMGVQGTLTRAAATDLGLKAGTPVAYRAGDQPNNALSLNVLEPGEVAATAGTSGVVYGITEERRPDPRSRVNTFAHVNHSRERPRLGVLLCINGAGALNAWTKRLLGDLDYPAMNDLAASVTVGSEGVTVLPFGNGPERLLGNRSPGAQVAGLDVQRHGRAHLVRAVQEGVVFAFQHGLEAMQESGLRPRTIRAGLANMFLSETFGQTLADVSGATLELFETDGSLGAARAAGVGAGVFASWDEAARTLERRRTLEPSGEDHAEAYAAWKEHLRHVSD